MSDYTAGVITQALKKFKAARKAQVAD